MGRVHIRLAILFCCLFVHGHSPAFAQEQEKSPIKKDNYIELNDAAHEDEYSDEYKVVKNQGKKAYIYEDVTMKALSKLYWGVGYLNLENDTYVDNYMKINECDMYKRYSGQEFEWKEIRDSTREFLRLNKADFSLRLQFVQPLMLLDYDFKRYAFKVDPKYSYNAARRLEVMSNDWGYQTCGDLYGVQGYPYAIAVELSRPFSLEYLPVESSIAKNYLLERNKIFNGYPRIWQTEKNMYILRKAYLLLKIKAFSSRGSISGSEGKPIAQIMATLEGYDVYSDINLKDLIASRSFIVQQVSGVSSQKLAEEFEILKVRHKGDGMLK